jgi:glutaredoxin
VSDDPDPSPSASPTAAPTIELLTRPGCSLCTTAREVVARVAGERDLPWSEQDVDADPELADRFGDRVPVVLLDGREHAYWRVDEQRLRLALRGIRSW